MKSLFKIIKDKIEVEVNKSEEEQRRREERLKQLEKLETSGGFHPIQAVKQKREIVALRKEIERYKERRRNKIVMIIVCAVFVLILAFVSVMSVFEKTPDSEQGESGYAEISEKETHIKETTIETTQEETTEVISANESENTEVIETTETEKFNTDYVSKETNESLNANGDSVTVPGEEETEKSGVWVPVNGGTKYHSYAGCSNMEDPICVSVETAENNGYEPCGRCH